MPNIDEQINLFRERLDNLDAEPGNAAQKPSLFLEASIPDAMHLLQGDINQILIQEKLQKRFDLTPTQKTDLEELRAKVRQKIADVESSVVKKSWTEVRQQAESAKPASAQSVFKQWAQTKRDVDENNDKNTPEGPGPLGVNKSTNK